MQLEQFFSDCSPSWYRWEICYPPMWTSDSQPGWGDEAANSGVCACMDTWTSVYAHVCGTHNPWWRILYIHKKARGIFISPGKSSKHCKVPYLKFGRPNLVFKVHHSWAQGHICISNLITTLQLIGSITGYHSLSKLSFRRCASSPAIFLSVWLLFFWILSTHQENNHLFLLFSDVSLLWSPHSDQLWYNYTVSIWVFTSKGRDGRGGWGMGLQRGLGWGEFLSPSELDCKFLKGRSHTLYFFEFSLNGCSVHYPTLVLSKYL